MTKKEAKSLFGKRYLHLCRAMGYSPSSVSAWPDNLNERRINEVVGCAIRMGIEVPEEFLKGSRDFKRPA